MRGSRPATATSAAPGLDPRLRDALRLVLGDPDSASIGALRAELAGHGVTLAPDELARALAQLLAA